MIIAAALGLALLGAAWWWPQWRPLMVGAAFVPLVALVVLAAARARRGRHVRLVAATDRLVDAHLETLARRHLALRRKDHYGVEDSGPWAKELAHFIDKVLRPGLAAAGETFDPALMPAIEARIAARAGHLRATLAVSDDMDPRAFETWCAARLAELGWSSSTTKASGDQGADVLAEKGGLRVVLQCKMSKTAIGNKAVQEAFAAQRHYGAVASGVVSNAAFTASARALAGTTGVLLLHPADLDRIETLLRPGVTADAGTITRRTTRAEEPS